MSNFSKNELDENELEIWRGTLEIFEIEERKLDKHEQKYVLGAYISCRNMLNIFLSEISKLPEELLSSLNFNPQEVYFNAKNKNLSIFINTYKLKSVYELEEQYEEIYDLVSDKKEIIKTAKEKFLLEIQSEKANLKEFLDETYQKVDEYFQATERALNIIKKMNLSFFNEFIEVISSVYYQLLGSLYYYTKLRIEQVGSLTSKKRIVSKDEISKSIDLCNKKVSICETIFLGLIELVKEVKKKDLVIEKINQKALKLSNNDTNDYLYEVYSFTYAELKSFFHDITTAFERYKQNLETNANMELLIDILKFANGIQYSIIETHNNLPNSSYKDIFMDFYEHANKLEMNKVEYFDLSDYSFDTLLSNVQELDEFKMNYGDIDITETNILKYYEILFSIIDTLCKFSLNDFFNYRVEKIVEQEKEIRELLTLIEKDNELNEIVYKFFEEPETIDNNKFFMRFLEEKDVVINIDDLDLIRKTVERYKTNINFRKNYKINFELNLEENIILFYSIFGEYYENYLNYFINSIFFKQLYKNDLVIEPSNYVRKVINEYVDSRKYSLFKNSFLKSTDKSITISDTDGMTGIEFEMLISKIYSNMGYRSLLTKTTGDQGADLLLEKYGESTVVQAKCYSSTVGNKAVQEVVASKKYYQANSALVVTNSYFSKSAKELADSNKVKLIDRIGLEKILDEYYY